MIAEVTSFVKYFLKERPDLFLLDIKEVGTDFFKVTIDGDKCVTIADCIELNRSLEKYFNSEEEICSLGFEVSTPDITAPILVCRQYLKNRGRKLKLTTQMSIFEGNLEQVNDEGILLKWEQREPKPIGKGKVTVVREQFFKYEIITQAVVVLDF